MAAPWQPAPSTEPLPFFARPTPVGEYSAIVNAMFSLFVLAYFTGLVALFGYAWILAFKFSLAGVVAIVALLHDLFWHVNGAVFLLVFAGFIVVLAFFGCAALYVLGLLLIGMAAVVGFTYDLFDSRRRERGSLFF